MENKGRKKYKKPKLAGGSEVFSVVETPVSGVVRLPINKVVPG